MKVMRFSIFHEQISNRHFTDTDIPDIPDIPVVPVVEFIIWKKIDCMVK